MDFRELGISGAFEVSLLTHGDERGFFSEVFKKSAFESATRTTFVPEQFNLSKSGEGVLRGIHFADVPKGQAKYVQVLSGSIRDYIVDLRVGSPTFGKWEAITLSSPAVNSVYIPIGVGHAFLSLEPNTLVAYMVSSEFNPTAEHAIFPGDTDLNLDYKDFIDGVLISEKDSKAPSFSYLVHEGLLPKYEDCIGAYSIENLGVKTE